MKYKLIAIIIFLALCCSLLQAQDTFPNTLALDTGSQSPEATLSDIAWIQGHWKGEAFGGITEDPEFLVRYTVVGGDRPARNMAEYIRFEGEKIAESEVFMGRELE